MANFFPFLYSYYSIAHRMCHKMFIDPIFNANVRGRTSKVSTEFDGEENVCNRHCANGQRMDKILLISVIFIKQSKFQNYFIKILHKHSHGILFEPLDPTTNTLITFCLSTICAIVLDCKRKFAVRANIK